MVMGRPINHCSTDPSGQNFYRTTFRIFSGVLGLVKHPDSQKEKLAIIRGQVFCICGHATREHSQNPKCRKCDCKEFKLLV
jgi:hypothetical protein